MPTTTDPAEKLGAIAAAIAELFEGIEGLTVLDYDPVGVPLDLPCAYVAEFNGSGTAVDEQGHELGHDDYEQVWTVRLLHDADGERATALSARSIFGQMLAAVNGDFRLNGEVREAVLEGYRMDLNDPEETRRMHVGELNVGLLYLMTTPE